MVTRCADCGFDLAGGRVEVVPTAHYMMGGAVFEPDCSTEVPGLFLAGEDSGGVHGANRLGGNGVANSTVFGGIAGDTMAAYVARTGAHKDPDEATIAAARAAALHPFEARPGDLNGLRQRLESVMWERVGILRDGAGLTRGINELSDLAKELNETGLPDSERAFNLTWHDWLNLNSQIRVGEAIARAALARAESRGAHFREDFPETGDLDTSAYTVVRQQAEGLAVATEPVAFTIVRPGESLIAGEAGAPPTAAQ
jgi:fumarate reductase flavoprotein subunit